MKWKMITDLLNMVQRHTKCNSSYCLRKQQDDSQYCRFHFPFDHTDKTHIDFEEVKSKRGEIQFRPKIVLKRNDTRVNRHQRIQLQGWRANTDIQPIIDYTACLEYLAKYASKPEKLSDVVRDAFVHVVDNLKGTEHIKSVIQKLMMKSVGERDFSAQEVMHSIMSLKLVSSAFQVLNVSLDGSRKIKVKSAYVETEPSLLDNYANRRNIKGCSKEILECNFVNFVANFTIVKNEIKRRPKVDIVRAFPSPYCSPKSSQYPMFCKYQLLKLKPWYYQRSDAWDNNDEEDGDMFCEKWNEYLQSDIGQSLVPNWRRELNNNAESYFSETLPRSNDDEYTQCDDTIQSREEWMEIADLCANSFQNNPNNVDIEEGNLSYWQSFRQNYTEVQLGSMPFWLEEAKKNDILQNDIEFEIDVDSFNDAQRTAYMIVSNHFETPDKQLLMMITGLAGSGKSYVINSIRSLLREVCLITAYFGIAAFNVKGKTLHSILQLPIRGKNSHELKGDALLKLQKRLSGIQYIIIDEYSVVGQKLLGWIDRRCRQATTKNDEPFGGISIILVGDIAQLPPVGDKVLYYKRPVGETDTLAFMMYRKFETVIKLTKNERSTGDGDSQEQFRNLLYNLRNGDSSVDDWHRLLTRTPDKIGKDVDVKQYVKLSFSNEKVANNN